MLFRLVGDAPGPALGGEGGGTAGIQHEEPLEGVDPGARPAPVLVAVPFELGAHRLGHAPSVDVAEPAQDAPGHPHPEGVDEFLPEKSLGHGVEDERPLAGETDEPPSGIEFQEFLQVEFLDTHVSPRNERAPFYQYCGFNVDITEGTSGAGARS